MIVYKSEKDLDLDAVAELYRASPLGKRRAVHNRARLEAMLASSQIVVSAWDRAHLVGLARSISDFSYCTYLADLTVDTAYRRRGIGRELVRRTRKLGGRATVVLFASPEAVEYYPRIGFVAGSGWMLRENDRVR